MAFGPKPLDGRDEALRQVGALALNRDHLLEVVDLVPRGRDLRVEPLALGCRAALLHRDLLDERTFLARQSLKQHRVDVLAVRRGLIDFHRH